MSQQINQEEIIVQLERLLQLLSEQKDSSATGTAPGTSPGRKRVSFYDRRVRDLRYSQQAKIHGNPAGLAKGTRANRDRKMADHRRHLAEHGEGVSSAHFEAVDALGFALDAERFLGSFSWGVNREFPLSTIDDVAERMIMWLWNQGYEIAPLGNGHDEQPKSAD